MRAKLSRGVFSDAIIMSESALIGIDLGNHSSTATWVMCMVLYYENVG
jgi:hypothetical protein